MLKRDKKANSSHQTPHSETEKQETHNGKVGAYNNHRAAALDNTKNNSQKHSSETLNKPLDRTSYEVVESVPFSLLLDTQRRYSPVKSHRMCGAAPFLGHIKDKPEPSSYIFRKEQGKSLEKDGIFYCNSPLCLWCEHKRRNDRREELELVLNHSSKEKVFGTFTAKMSGNLSDFADKMTDAFARTMTSLMAECEKLYGEKPLYVKVVEITTNPYKGRCGSVHYHLHFVVTFRGNTDDDSNVLRFYNLKWMEEFLVNKWAKFGTKVGLIVRKKSQDVKLIGMSRDDVAKVAVYLTKGLALELSSQQTKESKVNYSLKTLIALVSQGCEQALRLYKRVAGSLFGKRFLTKSQGWNEFYRELLEQQAEEVSDTEGEQETVEVVEMKVDRMFYKATHLSFGSFGDDLFSYVMMKNAGEDAFHHLKELCSEEYCWELSLENTDEHGVIDEEVFIQNVKELLLEMMHKHQIEKEDIKGRMFSFKTYRTE